MTGADATDYLGDVTVADDHGGWLDAAIGQARIGAQEGGIPVGAALVADGKLLAVGRNRRVQWGSAIRHGETDCLEQAGRLPAATYARATMYTTLSPCDMCSGAILLYGIRRVVIGENETFPRRRRHAQGARGRAYLPEFPRVR